MADHALRAAAKAAAATGGTPSFSDTYSFLSPPTSEDTVRFLLVRQLSRPVPERSTLSLREVASRGCVSVLSLFCPVTLMLLCLMG